MKNLSHSFYILLHYYLPPSFLHPVSFNFHLSLTLYLPPLPFYLLSPNFYYLSSSFLHLESSNLLFPSICLPSFTFYLLTSSFFSPPSVLHLPLFSPVILHLYAVYLFTGLCRVCSPTKDLTL